MANNNDKFISRENAKTLWGYMIDLLTGKQNKLTFDNTPTQDSDNPVKSGGIFTALAGKGTYSKPQNGIPKTDLENAVQTSLGLADSALQSETDPTVPSWAKQTNKPSYTQDEVGDGTTYKRVNQTEKDTWSGKQNALSTTQMQAVNSGITSEKVTQISTNQTNILLVEKSNPMCNELHYNVEDLKKLNSSEWLNYSWSYNVASLSGIKFTINEDNSISWVATNLANTAWFKLYDSAEMPAIASGEYVLHGCPSGGGISTYELEAVVGGSDKKEYGGSISFTVSNNLTIVAIGIRAGTSSGTFYPVLINKSLYDAGITDYVVPAKQNNDLTRLQSEDRASLAEVVDSGAKNQWNPSKVVKTYTHNGVTFTLNDDGVITANGTATGNDAVFGDIGSGAYKANKILFIEGSLNSGQYGAWFFDIYDEGWHNREICYSGTKIVYKESKSTTAIWRLIIQSGVTCNNATFKPMVCDLADWKVSQKYVPYRPSWDLVGMLVPKTYYYTTNFSAANTWTYSNLSFTVPAGEVYILIASMSWNSGKPTGICLSTASTPTGMTSADIVAINETAGNAITCMLQMPADASVDKTFYCYVKNESASGSSPTRLTAIRIK